MKKIISLLLAIMMIAALAVSVSADPYDEVQIEGLPEGVEGYDVEGASSEMYAELFEVTKRYFVASFTFPLAEKAGTTADNGCIGLTIGDENYQCLYVAHDIQYPDENMRGPGFEPNDMRAQLRVGQWWGTSAFGAYQINYIDGQDGSIGEESFVGQDITIYVEGKVELEDESTGAWMVTMKAWINDTPLVLNGGEMEVTAYDFDNNPYVGYGCKLTGVTAQIKFAQSNKEIDRSVLVNGVPDDTGFPGIDGNEPAVTTGTTGGDDEPATTTGDNGGNNTATTTGDNGNNNVTTDDKGTTNTPDTTKGDNTQTDNKEEDSSNLGLIIGIAAAAVVVIAVVVVVIVKKKK